MKVVLDTNVIVSAFLMPRGNPAAILRLALRGDFLMCFNTAILVEYEEVLSRTKFAGKIFKPTIQRFIDILHDMGEDVITTPSSIEMPDESDRIFYDTAHEVQAILVTGNQKHYPIQDFIMSPAEFLLLLASNA